jgi:hypothetical protein
MGYLFIEADMEYLFIRASKADNYTSVSVSLRTVFFTVTRSPASAVEVVRLVVEVERPLRPPPSRAISNNIKSAAPTTQTQGEAYQFVLVVVVFVVEVDELPDVVVPPLSCAKTITCIHASTKVIASILKENGFINCFILFFLVKKFPVLNTSSIQQLRQPLPGSAFIHELIELIRITAVTVDHFFFCFP